MTTLFVGIISFNSVVPLSVEERASYYRERASQTYNALWYFLAGTIVQIPYVLVTTLIFTVIYYPFVGFTGSVGDVIIYFLLLSLYSLMNVYMGQLAAYALPSVDVAMSIGALVNSIFILFMGFNPPTSAIPKGYKWLATITPPKYSLSVLVAEIFAKCENGNGMGCATMCAPSHPQPNEQDERDSQGVHRVLLRDEEIFHGPDFSTGMRGLRSKKVVEKGKAAASSLRQTLESLADPSYAKKTERFFHRSYCESDIFIGIRMPQCRAAVKAHIGTTTLQQVKELLHDARHEMRMAGFISLADVFHSPAIAPSSWWDTIDQSAEDSDDQKRLHISQLYLAETRYCNNWDLVDCSTNKILGETLVRFHAEQLQDYATITKIEALPDWYQTLLCSHDLWETRISIVLLLKLISTHRSVVYKICLYHLERFDADPSLRCTIKGVVFPSLDLIHKALGWILRETGKQNQGDLVAFLEAHATKAHKTTVRYATEHLDKSKAKRFVNQAKSS
ncbi:unnamed protein product [Aphanomyces euteiches]